MARRSDAGRGASREGGHEDALAGLRRLQGEIDRARRPAARASAPGPPPGGPPGGPPGPPPTPAPEPGRHRRRRRRRSLRHRLLVTAIVVLLAAVAVAGGGWGYLEWKLSQIKSYACSTCASVASGQPYNVLIVGSDSRSGDTGSAAQAFGNSSEVGGQRSDTIKIVHVDPATHTARLLSIPRDTFVKLSGLPPGTGLAEANKINAAFNNGPDPLIETIEDTFGIPIAHYVTIDFNGVINLVNAVGGVNLDFPYPVRDDDDGNNNSGLNIPHAGCQTLNGTMALALSRSRYYQYYEDGYWHADPTGDLGRIQRQNVLIEATIDKAKGTINPLTLNSFLGAVVNDITKDSNLSGTGLASLVRDYHAFSGSDLQTFTIPTTSAENSWAGDVQIVSEPQAEQVITAFLGQAPQPASSPPLDASGYEQVLSTTTTAPAASTPAPSGTASGSSTPTTTAPTSTNPPYDPTPC